jgi:lipooligosaccharide transport system permease protein
MSDSRLPVWPRNAWNWGAVWRRNFLAWKRLAFASMVGSLADPMMYLFGLGLGLGAMVGRVDGTSYIAFLAGGMVASSAMLTASFETIYASFSRMHVQRNWDAILHTRLTLGDVVLGEVVWAGSKALLSGTAIMLVSAAMGYSAWPAMLFSLPIIAITGLAFAALAMIVVAVSPSYDYFVFYQTLVLTPMLFFCGGVFPIARLPHGFRQVADLLPLTHAVALIRPLMLGRVPDEGWWHAGSLCVYALCAFLLSTALLRRRLMR